MTLSVAVGPGQPVGIVVRLAGEEQLRAVSVEEHLLGDGAVLRGQRLLVDAVVVNDNPQTDRVAARLRLAGGAEPGEWKLQADLEDGAMGRFSFTITFV